MTSNCKTNVLLPQISCILFEYILEIQWLWEETLSRWHNLLFSFKSVCSVAVKKAQNVPLTLGQFWVLVPVVRRSEVTSGNTESSVSCNSGEEVICVDLNTDKTFDSLKMTLSTIFNNLSDKKTDPVVGVLTSVECALNAESITFFTFQF